MSASAAAVPQPRSKPRAFLRLVMIEHSVFALPFAYIAALTAMFQLDGTFHWGTLLLVTVAMVGLRTFAMAANRIIDREIDARNPRTEGRELVTGAVTVKSAWTGALVALVFFLGAAALLNPSAWRWRPWPSCRWSSIRTASGSRTSRTRSWVSPRPSARSVPGWR